MARKNIFNLEFSKVSGFDDYIPNITKFIIDNRNICLPISVLRNIYQISPLIYTPSNVIFDHLRSDDKLDKIFAPIYVNRGVVPELLTTNDITIDTKQIDNPNVFKNYPEFYNKVIINLTPILRYNPNTNNYVVSDINVLHTLFTKAALVASYQDSDGWLTPTLSVFIVKTYSMIISGLIAKMFNLTLNEQLNVAAAFAMYMCQQLGSARDDFAEPALFNNCRFLSSKNTELHNLVEAMRPMTSTGLNISKLCQLVVDMGPQRIKNFNSSVLYRLIGSLGTSSIQMGIALEYPPYWTYQMILGTTNNKIKMYHELKGNRLLDEAKLFTTQLNTSNNFISNLYR